MLARHPLRITTAERLVAVGGVAIAMLGFAVPATRDWVLRPWSGAGDHRLAMWAAWHGRLMVLGWAMLIPLGTLVARYFKIWPGQDWPAVLDTRHWWHLHRLLQTAGIAVALVAVSLVLPNARGATPLARWHAWLGWTMLGLGVFQIGAGLLRGSKGGPTDPRAAAPLHHGDHYAMTRRRLMFEWSHKLGGYVALLLSLAVVPAGLAIADAPRWMWLAIAGWWLALGWTAARLQRAGWCVDTYQAIWGNSSELPGLARRAVGWGIRRSSLAERERC